MRPSPNRPLDMRASKVKTIRSLDRGLDVLLALEAARAASLHDLHVHTGLPKATLTRILLTLEGRGLIWQRVADSKYRPAYGLKARARHIEETDRVVEAASPVLLELTRTTGLAAHLAVPRDDHMEICEARRPNAPLEESRRRVGRRINMLLSALGRAYLAFSPSDERDRALERLQKGEGPGYDLARDRNWVKRMLEETRRQGYGTRDPADRGDSDRPKRPFKEDTTAIAVPIIVRGRVVGAINLLWRRNLASTRQIARRYLKDLSTAAAHIGQRLGDDAAT
jgi:IclR family transcriptional regulator, mhp operon transcriptional activator